MAHFPKTVRTRRRSNVSSDSGPRPSARRSFTRSARRTADSRKPRNARSRSVSAAAIGAAAGGATGRLRARAEFAMSAALLAEPASAI